MTLDDRGPEAMQPMPDVAGSVRHLYVHAPFCARRCIYCDFAVQVNAHPDAEPWQERIVQEWQMWHDRGVRTDAPLATLYVGGGTPSLLPGGSLIGLARSIGVLEPGGSVGEWTAEANPESFTESVAREWIEAGVNRVSLGAQTFSPSGLRWMGRLHAPEDVAAAVERARMVGISNLSADLILGLPDSADRSWEEDLDRMLTLDLPHISVYGLTVEKDTPLAGMIREGRTDAPSESRYRREFLQTADRLSAEGYDQYEVSNFARPGFESRHNRAYWDRSDYLGLGNGAHSFVDGVRWWNDRAWERYGRRVASGVLPVAGWERPRVDQVRLEELWLALRTNRGLDVREWAGAGREMTSDWIARGWARRSDDRIRMTPEGWLVMDELVAELDAALEEDAPQSP